MIPSKPRYDGTDRAWLVSINDARYPVGRDANWYVRAFFAVGCSDALLFYCQGT